MKEKNIFTFWFACGPAYPLRYISITIHNDVFFLIPCVQKDNSTGQYHDYISKFNHVMLTFRVKEMATISTESNFSEENSIDWPQSLTK